MRSKSKYLLSVSLIGLVSASASGVIASSHREAPAIAGQPRIDSTDFYMFRSYENRRTSM